MARPGLIAALLLPLPFAALPLVAVLMGGPSLTGNEDAVYAPITSPVRDADKTAGLASWHKGRAASVADDYRHGCDNIASES